MAHGNPLISVIIPTYNRAAYLGEAVASVLSQTYARFELIVVDDGSSDDTDAFLASVRDSRVRALRLTHTGSAAAARNAGIRMAGGAYVAFLDSDDLWLPEKLERQVRELQVTRALRWSYTNYRMIDAGGRSIPIPAGGPWQAYSGWILEDLIWTRAAVVTPTVMVERELLVSVGGFDEGLALNEDYELWLRLARVAEVRAVSGVLTVVRHHPGRRTEQRLDSLDTKVTIYDRLRRATRDRRLRAACRHQSYRHRLEGARVYGAVGARWTAARWLFSALRYGPPGRDWLTAAARFVLGQDD